MEYIKEFSTVGVVKEGTLKIPNASLMTAFLQEFDEDTKVEIVIRKAVDSRSIKLNRTYWMYLTLIADHLGYTKSEMHDFFKQHFLCEYHAINGEEILVCKSTAKLSNKQFCEYLERIFQMSAERFGYVLPDIEDIKKMKRAEK